MPIVAELDRDAISRACELRGVQRLRIFGSAVTDRFDATTSDLDFLVEFDSSVVNRFHAYFDLRDDLVRITGRDVDLIEANAIKNPYFARAAFESDTDLYAA